MYIYLYDIKMCNESSYVKKNICISVCMSVCPLDINCDNLLAVNLGLIVYYGYIGSCSTNNNTKIYLLKIKNGGHLRFMCEILVK